MFSFECNSHKKNILILFLGQFENETSSILSSDIQKAFEENLRPDFVIFLYPKYLQADITELGKKDSFITEITRQKHSPVQFISFSQQGDLIYDNKIGNNQDIIPALDEGKLVKDLIRSGYEKLMEKREKDVLVQAPSGTTFVKPSGKSLEEFIYASQLARCNFEHQFLAFSLLHYAPDVETLSCIYIDTSSISAIAESLTYYLSRFNSRNCKHIRYKSFSSYSGLDQNKPDDIEGAWVIISASASTSMGKQIVKDWTVRPEQVITILSYEEPHTEDGINSWDGVVFSVSKYSTKQKKSFSPVKVQVQGENFTAEVSLPGQVLLKKIYEPIYINQAISKYAEKEIFYTHRCNRAIYVDYLKFREPYLNSEKLQGEFYEWLKKVVSWTVPNNLKAIIISNNEPETRLLDDLKVVLNDCGFKYDDLQVYRPEDENKYEKIGGGTVLVLASAISSGRSFIDINRSLRFAKHQGMRIFLTPFTTASSKNECDNFKKSLCQGPPGFKYIYKSYKTIYVGDNTHITWDFETKLIRDMLDLIDPSDAGYDYWIKRKSQLEKVGTGIMGQIGLSYHNVDKPLTFSPDFAFWPEGYNANKVNNASVFATVAAVLQNLRENEFDGVTLKSNVYKHFVLDPENFVRFNDPILQSCLWRAAMPQELDYRRSDELSNDIQRIFSKILQSSKTARGEVALDLLMAIAIGWIKLTDHSSAKLLKEAEDYLTESHAKILVEFLKK